MSDYNKYFRKNERELARALDNEGLLDESAITIVTSGTGYGPSILDDELTTFNVEQFFNWDRFWKELKEYFPNWNSKEKMPIGLHNGLFELDEEKVLGDEVDIIGDPYDRIIHYGVMASLLPKSIRDTFIMIVLDCIDYENEDNEDY